MSTSETNSSLEHLAGKYLAIVLANESYGISVLSVREIIRTQKITPVPQMPEFVKGVINLRGRVIPVVDLRVKFGLPAEMTERTCIVVVQVDLSAAKAIHMGLMVDAVEEVLNVSAVMIEPTPEFGAVIDTSYLLGIATTKGQVKMLLDINRVVAAQTVHDLANTIA